MALWLLIQIAQASPERAAQLQHRMLRTVDEDWEASTLQMSERASAFIESAGRELVLNDADAEIVAGVEHP